MYKVIINNGLNPDTIINCDTDVEALQEYLQCCSVFGYDKVKIIKSN